MSPIRLIIIAAVAALAQACTGTERIGAASDIHAFLLSIRDTNQAAFDAHVDRAALKAQLHERLMAEAARRRGGLGALAAAFGGPLVDVAVDELVQPEVFRAVADYLGYAPDKPIPNTFEIAEAVKPIDDTHVCVAKKRDQPCIIDFTDEDGVWRLSGFEGDISMLRPPKRR